MAEPNIDEEWGFDTSMYREELDEKKRELLRSAMLRMAPALLKSYRESAESFTAMADELAQKIESLEKLDG